MTDALRAAPPEIAPESWEDFAVFRETFLLLVTDPDYNSGLRSMARMLHELVLNYEHWPALPETATTVELRAALADLRQLQGYFASLGKEQEDASLKNQDARLAVLAARHANELGQIAAEVEQALADRQ